jgi:Na+-transporting methylmalonyl-CoA/oxaloacetate decarboxylase gamma subunit
MIDLSAGESKRLRLKVNSSQPGEASFTFALANSPDVSGHSITYEMSSEGEIITDVGTNMTFVTLSVLSVLIIVAFVGLLIRRMGPETENTPLATPSAAPTAAAFSAPVDATPCWSCRQPILSGMLGYPGCGARYHSVCDVKECLNCESGADSFVVVE